VQANLMSDFQARGVVAEAQHTYDPHIRMEGALKRDVERSQLMYKHEMIDSMLSQLANIDQDTNLPVNSYDIDLPIWMSLDQGDPFADVELGSDLSNLRDRFFPDSHRIVADSNSKAPKGGLGLDGTNANHNAAAANKAGGPGSAKKSRGGSRKNSSNSGSSSDTSNLAKSSTARSSQHSGSAKSNGRKNSASKLQSSGGSGVINSKLVKKAGQNGGKNSKGNASGSANSNGRGSPRPNGSEQSANDGDNTANNVSNGNNSSNGLHRRKKHHNPWTAEETQALIEGVGICGGGKWADIKKLGLKAIERRSAVDLKDKWRNLLRVALLPQQTLRQIERKRGQQRDARQGACPKHQVQGSKYREE